MIFFQRWHSVTAVLF